jgi:phosphate transport system substrate-binding protein
MAKFTFLTIFIFISAYMCANTETHASEIRSELRIDGGAAPINNIFRRIKEPFEKQSKIKLVLTEQGPDVALKELDEGKIDLATAGLPFTDWVSLVEKQNYTLKNKTNIKIRVIGRDLIQVYVNPDVHMTQLNKKQLKDIFTGKVTNWKELGGADAKITVVFGTKIPGTNKVWQKEIMDEAAWVGSMKSTETAPDIAKEIAATPGAIGIGPIGLDTQNVRVRSMKTPAVGRPIVAASVGQPNQEVADLLEFITKHGQEYTK